MNRNIFLEHFKEKYQDKYLDEHKVLFFNAHLSSFDNNKLLSTMYINSLLKDDFKSLGINTEINIDKSIINTEFDYDYNEDENNTTSLIRHNININLNVLFDYIVDKSPELNNNKKTLYRIEHQDGTNLYEGIGFKIMSEDIKDNEQQSPSDDNNFMSILKFDIQDNFIINGENQVIFKKEKIIEKSIMQFKLPNKSKSKIY